jgi:hypothetical protein
MIPFDGWNQYLGDVFMVRFIFFVLYVIIGIFLQRHMLIEEPTTYAFVFFILGYICRCFDN